MKLLFEFDIDKKKILLESKLSYYLAKKERLSAQFGIETIGDEEFAKGVLEEIKKHEKRAVTFEATALNI